jgi:tetraacyldisaccharide 4'-kinase
MLSPTQFRELVSGRRRGIVAALLRAGLATAEIPYAWAMRLRNRRYDRGRAEIHRVSVPVVSVGNLTLGGTGKTPMVEWIARWFRQRKVRVALVSRGYGTAQGEINDEALELEQKLPDVPHLQNPDRVAAAAIAVEELECELLLLDDAFQHRRIARDLDIVLIDALEPFGFGHVFPRGTLREPTSGLARADVVALSRADMLDEANRADLRAHVKSLAPGAAWCEVVHEPGELVNADGARLPLDRLVGQPILAFCGIGNPAGFRHTLSYCGYDLLDFREFPDHHKYSRSDIELLSEWAAEHRSAAIVCTQKDLVKIGVPRLGGAELWAVGIAMRVITGEQELEARLQAVLASVGDRATDVS